MTGRARNYLDQLLGLEQSVVFEIVVAEHEADEVIFAAGIAAPVLHRRQTGVVIQQQTVLETKKEKGKPTMTKER